MTFVPDDYEVALEDHEQRIEEEAAAFAREDRDGERADAPRPCWHCGGSGVRCCEFAADRRVAS